MDTKERIMKAALELFSTKGYAAVRTKEIAKCAGVNETTLFRHFSSKRKLFESIIIDKVQVINHFDVFHSSSDDDYEAVILGMAIQVYLLYQSNAQLIKMIMKGLIDEDDELRPYQSECRGGQLRQVLIDYLQGLVARKVINDDPILIAELLMSLMHGYAFGAFILEDKRADFAYFKQMIKKAISVIN